MGSAEKQVSINVPNDDGTEKEVTFVVKSPSAKTISEAQRKAAVVWANCIKDGVLTKDELEIILEERGIWSQAHEDKKEKIMGEINSLEKMLFIGNKSRKMTAEKGRELALEMRKKREEIRDLMAKKLAMEANTAESLSENAKFDFLVSQCIYDTNGQPYYENEQDYSDNADGLVAFKAAQELAAMMYALEDDFEAKLPENVYLKEFNHVDDQLRLINKDGDLVDAEGRVINELGHFIDGEGNRVDKDGHRLDENGMYMSPTKKTTTTRKKTTDTDS